MLHEILLGLLGECGGIIHEVEGKFKVRKDCYFLNGSEQQLVNMILQVASHYKYLCKFVSKYGAMSTGLKYILSNSDEEEAPGLYLKAYSRGIKNLLDEYRSRIASIEQEYLQGRTVTIPSLLEYLACEDLESIAKMTQIIQEQKLRGTQIIDLVCSEERCIALKQKLQGIREKLLQVFFHQLGCWCVHGQLLDTFQEFFIKEREGEEWSSKFILNLDMIADSVISPRLAEKALFIGKAIRTLGDSLPNEEANTFARALQQVQTNFSKLMLGQVLERIRRSVSNRLWNLVVVKSDLLGHIKALKNYFLLSRGEFFLTFIEESSVLMELPPKPGAAEKEINQGPFMQAQTMTEEDLYLESFKLSIHHYGFNFERFKEAKHFSMLRQCKISEGCAKIAFKKFRSNPGAIWVSKKQQVLPGFSTQFTFKHNSLVDMGFMLQSEKEVSGQSESHPVVPENLKNGLVVKIEIKEGNIRPRVVLNGNSIAEGNLSFEESTVKVSIDFENESLRVRIEGQVVLETDLNFSSVKLDTDATAFVGLSSKNNIEILNWGFTQSKIGMQPGVFDSWSGLTLEYEPKWPLNLMLSPQILDKYTSLFRFLFALKRAQFKLHRTWLEQTKRLNYSLPAMQLRSQMNFLLDNLMSYFQLDIIEAHFVSLNKQINESQDFEEVRRYHDQYVSSIASHCFLNAPKIVRAIQEIVRSCHELCSALLAKEDLEQIRRRFDQESLYIFKMLSGVRNQHSALGQLLLRLDFNGFYTKLKEREARPF